MFIEESEVVHISNLLIRAKTSLLQKDPALLRELSNQTIHSSCSYQDHASTTISVILYALSKLIEREDYRKIKNWDKFVKKLNSIFDLAVKALHQDNEEKYEKYIEMARKTLESNSINLKPYIQDILKKAAINKGSKIYEHGISLEHTSKILGITQWEILEYIGQKNTDVKQDMSIDIKKRAKTALEFFS